MEKADRAKKLMKEYETPKWAIRLGMLFLALFLGSCMKSCEEIGYYRRAKQAKAKIFSIKEERARGIILTGYEIWYEFSSEYSHKIMKGKTLVGVEEAAKYSIDQIVDIEYYGADTMSRSRILGQGSFFWPVLCMSSIVVGIVGTGMFLTLRSYQMKRNRRPPSSYKPRSAR